MRQLKLGPMDNFVYLLGARDAPEVAVIDPAWDLAAIERAAGEDGKRISAAIVSHCHRDHINALPDLLARHDVPVYAHKEEAGFSEDLRKGAGDALRSTGGGEVVKVGPLEVKLLHTPGHTPGSQCVLCGDALVSGDTLFINACGRCDLKGGNPEDMYRSITGVLMRLPDTTRLFPGHDYADVPVAEMGAVKQSNPYFQFHDLPSFVAFRMRPRK
jgi:glyoxylase-like metal-dependent hydrolase (beta-lactamase superfamily II)